MSQGPARGRTLQGMVRVGLVASLATLALAAPAQADTVSLGAVAPSGTTMAPAGTYSYLQSAGGSPGYAVPSGGGVITSFSVRGGSSVPSGDVVRLRVFRPSGGSYTIAAESGDVAPQVNTAGSYSVHIPVNAGDVIGLRVSTTGDTAAYYTGQSGDIVKRTFLGPDDTGTLITVPGDARVNVSAQLETPSSAPPPDPDTDHDGVVDRLDVCPTVADANQADADADHVGDPCDADDDNDGLSDDAEVFLHTSRIDVDTDDDGISDANEERADTDPRRADTDRDGLPDGLELGVRRGIKDPPGAARGTNPKRFRRDLSPRTHTNPLRRDTDRDGLTDGREDRNHNGRRDRGETDPRRRDTDGDGVPDGAERFPLERSR